MQPGNKGAQVKGPGLESATTLAHPRLLAPSHPLLACFPIRPWYSPASVIGRRNACRANACAATTAQFHHRWRQHGTSLYFHLPDMTMEEATAQCTQSTTIINQIID